MPVLPIPCKTGLVVVAFALIALTACRERQAATLPLPTSPSSPEEPRAHDEVVRLIQRKNEAIAEMENGRFEPSVKLWEELAAELSTDPAVATNRVVAYVLLLKSPALSASIESEAYQTSARKAERAAEQLLQVAGGSAVSHLLASKVFRLLPDERRSLAEMDRAAELAPDDPIVWYELFQLGRSSEDEHVIARSRDGLKRAHELWPDNLAVLRERLLQQVRTRDPSIAETLAQIRHTVEPLVGSSLTWQRLNLLNMLDQALALVSEGAPDDQAKWDLAPRRILPIANVLSSDHATRIDLRRIDRADEGNLAELAFVRHDLAAPDLAEDSLRFEQTETPIPVKFVPAPEDQQLPRRSSTRSAEVVDFDLDGRLDVVVVRERGIEVYSRGREGDAWKSIAAFDSSIELRGVVAADLDRDVDAAAAGKTDCHCRNADVDLVAYGPGGVLVLENVLNQDSGDRSLKVAPMAAALAQLGNVAAMTAVDLDRDGDLDLVASSAEGVSLWSNRVGMAFEDLSGRGSPPPPGLAATAIAPVDWNRDGDVDVLLASASSGSMGCLVNHRHGRFRWEPVKTENEGTSGTSVLCLDGAEGHCWWTLVAGGDDGVSVTQTRIPESGLAQCLRTNKSSTRPVTGLTIWDYDNDGWPDILGWGKDGVVVYRGGPGSRFGEAPSLFRDSPTRVERCAVGDVDGDGDLDLLAVGPERPMWYTNQGGNRNHWLDVQLHADPYPTQSADLAVNMCGIGCVLELKVGARSQKQVVVGATTHFGLGPHAKADVLRVLWTNGAACNAIRPESNQILVKNQEHKGM